MGHYDFSGAAGQGVSVTLGTALGDGDWTFVWVGQVDDNSSTGAMMTLATSGNVDLWTMRENSRRWRMTMEYSTTAALTQDGVNYLDNVATWMMLVAVHTASDNLISIYAGLNGAAVAQITTYNPTTRTAGAGTFNPGGTKIAVMNNPGNTSTRRLAGLCNLAMIQPSALTLASMNSIWNLGAGGNLGTWVPTATVIADGQNSGGFVDKSVNARTLTTSSGTYVGSGGPTFTYGQPVVLSGKSVAASIGAPTVARASQPLSVAGKANALAYGGQNLFHVQSVTTQSYELFVEQGEFVDFIGDRGGRGVGAYVSDTELTIGEIALYTAGIALPAVVGALSMSSFLDLTGAGVDAELAYGDFSFAASIPSQDVYPIGVIPGLAIGQPTLGAGAANVTASGLALPVAYGDGLAFTYPLHVFVAPKTLLMAYGEHVLIQEDIHVYLTSHNLPVLIGVPEAKGGVREILLRGYVFVHRLPLKRYVDLGQPADIQVKR